MYIYKTTNLINGKIYIGLSTKPVEESISYKGSGALIKKAISKYGSDQFIKEILEPDVATFELLQELEIYYISKYRSTDLNIGYNICKGGRGILGYKHTDETRRKISIASANVSEDTIAKRVAANTGKIRSEETKAKTSETMKGRIYTEERKLNMSLAAKGKTKTIRITTCPYCNKPGAASLMTRYHFDNCKFKH